MDPLSVDASASAPWRAVVSGLEWAALFLSGGLLLAGPLRQIFSSGGERGRSRNGKRILARPRLRWPWWGTLRGLEAARRWPSSDLTGPLAGCVLGENDRVSIGALLAIGAHPHVYGAASQAVLALASVAPPGRRFVTAWSLERLADAYPGFIPIMAADRSPLSRLCAVRSAAKRLRGHDIGPDERSSLDGVLASGAGDPDARVRERACLALGDYPSVERIALLGKALDDSSLRVKRAAVSALGRTADAKALAALLTTLEVEDPPLIAEVTDALRKVPVRAPEVWVAAAYEGSFGRRVAALRALGTLRDVEVCETLLPLLNDGDKRIRRLAARVLASVAANAAPARPRLAVFEGVLRRFDSEPSRSAKEAMVAFLAISGERGILNALRARIKAVDPAMGEKLGEAAKLLEETIELEC
jgi:HEAT repeats